MINREQLDKDIEEFLLIGIDPSVEPLYPSEVPAKMEYYTTTTGAFNGWTTTTTTISAFNE